MRCFKSTLGSVVRDVNQKRHTGAAVAAREAWVWMGCVKLTSHLGKSWEKEIIIFRSVLERGYDSSQECIYHSFWKSMVGTMKFSFWNVESSSEDMSIFWGVTRALPTPQTLHIAALQKQWWVNDDFLEAKGGRSIHAVFLVLFSGCFWKVGTTLWKRCLKILAAT